MAEMQSPGRSDDNGRDGSLGHAIIRAVAAAEGTSPLELDAPLHEAIDPAALEQVVSSASSLHVVRFDYLDWTVDVRSGGKITVEARGGSP